MSKVVKIENDIDKSLRLVIKLQKDNIFKETFIETQKNIKMRTFFKVNYQEIADQIEDDSYSIYFLINDFENSIYIGKSKNFLSRLHNHYKNSEREFNKIIQLSGNDWTPTIIDYLEFWFIHFFYKNKIFAKFVNNKIEQKPNCTYSDWEYIDNALENLKWLLLTEGINISSNEDNVKTDLLIENKEIINSKDEYKVYFKNIEAIYCKKENSSQKIKLLKNTKVIWNEFDINNFPKSVESIRRYNKWFEENNKLGKITKISSNQFILNVDYKVSISFASCLIIGYFSRNGKYDWKTKDGKQIKDLEDKIITKQK